MAKGRPRRSRRSRTYCPGALADEARPDEQTREQKHERHEEAVVELHEHVEAQPARTIHNWRAGPEIVPPVEMAVVAICQHRVVQYHQHDHETAQMVEGCDPAGPHRHCNRNARRQRGGFGLRHHRFCLAARASGARHALSTMTVGERRTGKPHRRDDASRADGTIAPALDERRIDYDTESLPLAVRQQRPARAPHMAGIWRLVAQRATCGRNSDAHVMACEKGVFGSSSGWF